MGSVALLCALTPQFPRIGISGSSLSEATDPLLSRRRGPQARIIAIDTLRKPRLDQLLRYSFVLVLAYCRGIYEDAPRDIFSLVCLPQDHDPP
jgi:hypothetical protein